MRRDALGYSGFSQLAELTTALVLTGSALTAGAGGVGGAGGCGVAETAAMALTDGALGATATSTGGT
jgi:hypothetical protein